MENNEIIKALDRAVAFFRKDKFAKLQAAPGKYIFWKLFETFTSVAKFPVKLKTKTFWNEEMMVVIPEQVSIHLYRYKFFEEDLTKIFLNYLKPGMILFDVGSHFGYFSLLGSFLVGPHGQVHAFEPTPSTYNILKTNAQKKDNIKTNNCAVLDKEKDVLLNDFGLEYSAYNSLYKGKMDQQILAKIKSKQCKIRSISLDDYISANKVTPDFIKIDAENSEYDILIGMERTLKEIRPMIAMEFGSFCEGVQNEDLFNYLKGKGYMPFEYNSGEIMEQDITECEYRYNNLLFLPQ